MLFAAAEWHHWQRQACCLGCLSDRDDKDRLAAGGPCPEEQGSVYNWQTIKKVRVCVRTAGSLLPACSESGIHSGILSILWLFMQPVDHGWCAVGGPRRRMPDPKLDVDKLRTAAAAGVGIFGIPKYTRRVQPWGCSLRSTAVKHDPSGKIREREPRPRGVCTSLIGIGALGGYKQTIQAAMQPGTDGRWASRRNGSGAQRVGRMGVWRRMWLDVWRGRRDEGGKKESMHRSPFTPMVFAAAQAVIASGTWRTSDTHNRGECSR